MLGIYSGRSALSSVASAVIIMMCVCVCVCVCVYSSMQSLVVTHRSLVSLFRDPMSFYFQVHMIIT